MKFIFYKTILILTLILVFSISLFAQTERNRGIELYEQGDYQAAITNLNDSDKVEDLYFLGLSYEKIDKSGKAKDVFKKAFFTSYDVFSDELRKWQKLVKDETRKSFSDFLQDVKLNNRIGYVAAGKAFELKSDIFQTNEARIKAKTLSDAFDLAETGSAIYSSEDKEIKTIKVIQKAAPVYPKDSSGIPITRFNQRQNRTIIVTLFTVFGADGKVKLLVPNDEIIDGFTVEAINAASQIKFTPAKKDKNPVAYRANIQYSFGIR